MSLLLSPIRQKCPREGTQVDSSQGRECLALLLILCDSKCGRNLKGLLSSHGCIAHPPTEPTLIFKMKAHSLWSSTLHNTVNVKRFRLTVAVYMKLQLR